VGIKLLQLYVIIERYIEMRRGKKKKKGVEELKIYVGLLCNK